MHPIPNWLELARRASSPRTNRLDLRDRRIRHSALQAVVGNLGGCGCACYTELDKESILQSFSSQHGYATPKIDVRGAVIHDGKILLVQEKSDGKWCLPGGWGDVGDQPSAMVERGFGRKVNSGLKQRK